MKTKLRTELRFDCPECGKERFYTDKYCLKRVVSLNRVCRSCVKMGKRNPMYGKQTSKKQKEAVRKNNLKRFSDPEEIKKVSEWMKENNPMNNPEYRKKVSEAKKGKLLDEKTRQKIAESLKEYYKNHPEVIEEANKKKRLFFKNHPEVVKRMTAHVYDPKVREKMSKSMKILWANPDYKYKTKRAQLSGLLVHPNRFETSLNDVVQKNFSGEYKLNVKGDTILNGKIPDFINCNGQKKVILANGVYWHSTEPCRTKEQAENIEKKAYEELGFKVLFIWDDEMKNIENVVGKIEVFNNE